MTTSKRLPVRMRTIVRFGVAATWLLAVAAGCGSSDDSGSPGGGGSAGTAHGGKGGGAGSSHAGSAGTTNGGGAVGGDGATGGSMVNGDAGSPEAGAGGMAETACGDGKVEAGEECDDGNKKDGDGCSSICTNKCEQCEVAANCGTKYDLTQPCKTPAECQSRNNEAASFEFCYGTTGDGQTTAAAGPGAGALKSKLCQDAIACIRRTNCAANFDPSPTACYCGEGTDLVACETTPKGPCAEELARAAEARSFSALQQVWAAQDATKTAGAVAAIVVNCDQSACGRQCFQDKTPTKCEQCAVGSNAHDYHLQCPDFDACYFQVALSPDGNLPPLPIAKLCAPAVDCAIRTGCGAQGGDACYGNGTGPCAAEFAAAASSTDSATVLGIMHGAGQYAVNFAQSLLDCESTHCAADCFPAASGGGGGTGGASAGTGGASAGTGGASAGTGGTGG